MDSTQTNSGHTTPPSGQMAGTCPIYLKKGEMVSLIIWVKMVKLLFLKGRRGR